MKKVRGHFSENSEYYRKFRPSCTGRLYSEILQFVKTEDSCRDFGTGNGQVAVEFDMYFTSVFATGISQGQLNSPEKRKKIVYKKERAGQTGF